MSPPEERAIREALGKATPGPWELRAVGDQYAVAGPASWVMEPNDGDQAGYDRMRADYELIVAAVNGLPALLTALDTARAGEARLREAAKSANRMLRVSPDFAHRDQAVTAWEALDHALYTPASTWLTERDRATRAAALREAAEALTREDIEGGNPHTYGGGLFADEYKARRWLEARATAIAEGREP